MRALSVSAAEAHMEKSSASPDHAVVASPIRSFAGAGILKLLAEDFDRENNPVFVWEAISIASRCGLEMPKWVLPYLSEAADAVVTILGEFKRGANLRKKNFREAERAGKAIGFGKAGRGPGSHFEEAADLDRDRSLYFDVLGRLHEAKKETTACVDVAVALDTNQSMVERAYWRMKKLYGDAPTKHHQRESRSLSQLIAPNDQLVKSQKRDTSDALI